MLDRKLLRDLGHMKGQVATIAVMVACRVEVFIAALTTYHSLRSSQQGYYASARFAQIFTQVKRDPTAVAQQIRAIPSVADIETRIVVFSQDDTVKVPTGALFRDGEQWAVFIGAEGYARKRQVQVGKRNGLEAVVDNGLDPGEQVVLYPSDVVYDGARVRVRASDRGGGSMS